LIETLLNVCFYALIVAVWRVLIRSAGLEPPFTFLRGLAGLEGACCGRVDLTRLIMAKKDGP
jgi:hypothetical protein